MAIKASRSRSSSGTPAVREALWMAVSILSESIRPWLMPRMRRRAFSGAAATSRGSSQPAQEREERRAGDLEDLGQLRPVTSKPALEAMDELQVALLVQVHEV